MSHVRYARRFVDLMSLAVGMILLCLLFVGCWLLLQAREDSHLGPGANASSPSAIASSLGSPGARSPSDSRATERFDIADLSRSRQTLTMLCVLLAGLVGGYLQYMRERFSELAAEQQSQGKRGRYEGDMGGAGDGDGVRALLAFASQLLMGLGAASVLGLFIPLAIANPPGLSIYNPWGLLILGVISGYLSRNMFGGLQAKFERLFAELQRSGPLGTVEVTSAVKQGVLDALGSPQPVNFDGVVSLEVLDRHARSCVRLVEGVSFVALTPHESYTARIVFSREERSHPAIPSGLTNEQRIRIDRGVDTHPVPFQLRLELGFLPEVASLERSVELAAPSRESIEQFDFGFTASKPNDDTSSDPTDVVLFVYQNSLFCAAISLPVRWELLS
ncbi:MAG: hypothetical protein QM740_20715 [Acidovorax sp.]